MPTNKFFSLPDTITPEWLEIVRRKVDGLRFGIVQIVVHDHHVTQIEKTEKIRLDSPRSGAEFPRRVNS